MIRCEVTAHRLDLAAHWPLYAYEADGPRMALRWLRWQAGRLADRLDPDPQAAWVPGGALRPVDEAVPDAPTHMRCWRDDLAAHEEVMHLLAAGQAVSLSAHDDTAHYTFTALPRQFYVPPWAPPAPVSGTAREAVS
ncbi:hypothetical protein [Streptomyces sp. NBC_01750]|uniref:hypothetical protein n=1 Tax=Streptomyces sp. NBC_01750 TaxID=2975928 RepID=UPI002DDB9CF2|nr:hypothetical protein [Streptomyces sp. NBC_01750]WSD38156.1 hypothetical protein OG966_40400 [Streptomyces sp. NBC_01750]